MPEKPPAYVPPDYVRGRSPKIENQINQAFATVFAPDNRAGQLVLGYLQMTFINTICGPGDTDAALRHREGQRDLVRIIQQRIDYGQRNLPALAGQPEPSVADAGR